MAESRNRLLHSVRHAAKTVSRAAGTTLFVAGQKAESLVDGGKRRLQRMDLQAELNVKFREVGELMYATHTGHPTDSRVLLEKLETIDLLYQQLDAINKEEP